MTPSRLADLYRAYVACLNARAWGSLERFVDAEVRRNGERLGLAGYRAMLERDVLEIPDLRYDVQLLVSEPPRLASRLRFDCTPRGRFLGLDVGGRRVSFAENVLYELRGERIAEVWSVIDRAAIEEQLSR